MKLYFCTLFLCLGMHLNASIGSVIDRIKMRSEMSQSDALVILRQGKPLIVHQPEACAGIDSMEMTKPLIGLAIALLLDEGRLPCLDMPIHAYYPLWNCDAYRGITLRHLLSNISGLDSSSLRQVTDHPVTEILNSHLLFLPGTRYYKNPRAIQLLTDIVKLAAGRDLSQYLYERLFEPLGITDISWRTGGTIDSLPQFQMSAWDLAKVGSLIADEGAFQGKQLIGKRWLNELFMPSQPFDPFFGLQWWLEFYDIAAWWDEELLTLYSQQCVSKEIIAKLTALEGRVVHFSGQVYGSHIVKLRGEDLIAYFEEGRLMTQIIEETRCKGLPLAKFKTGKLKMASAHGQGGQHLIIMPQQKLVAVRQKRLDTGLHSENLNFDDLPDLLEEIAKACDCYIDG